MAIPAPRLQEIKTLSAVLGCGVHSNERHVHQFQLAALELEATRRSRERAAAIRRVRDLDARLAEIDARIRKHQEALGLTRADSTAGGEALAPARDAPSKTRRVVRYGA